MRLDHAPNLADVFEGRCQIAVLAPHPDDESLACGALLAQAFAGSGAHVICLTDGSASHPGSREWDSGRLAKRRRAELTEAITLLGGSAADLTWLGMADAKLYRVDPVAVAADLVERIAGSGARHVFAPAPQDHHEDHKATAYIAEKMRCLRPDWSFFNYPVWSRWDDPDFDQNIAHYAPYVLKTTGWQKQKRAAIAAHQSQLGAVVKDDPDGFVLSPEFIEKFAAEDEIFWRMT